MIWILKNKRKFKKKQEKGKLGTRKFTKFINNSWNTTEKAKLLANLTRKNFRYQVFFVYNFSKSSNMFEINLKSAPTIIFTIFK
jgi:hypothetical protein